MDFEIGLFGFLAIPLVIKIGAFKAQKIGFFFSKKLENFLFWSVISEFLN